MAQAPQTPAPAPLPTLDQSFELLKEFKVGTDSTGLIPIEQAVMQVHESVGHPTELDRVYGTEAAYAGTSFLSPGDLGNLRYGSEKMNITSDATTPLGLGTFGFDDEGVPAQREAIVGEGLLRGFLSSRETAARIGAGDTEHEASQRELLAGFGQVADGRRDQPADGVVLVVIEVGTEAFVEVGNRRQRVHHELAISLRGDQRVSDPGAWLHFSGCQRLERQPSREPDDRNGVAHQGDARRQDQCRDDDRAIHADPARKEWRRHGDLRAHQRHEAGAQHQPAGRRNGREDE